MILFITYPEDPAARMAERLLRARGTDVARFDALRIGEGDAHMTVRLSSRGTPQRRLFAQGRTLDLAALTAVWHRRHKLFGSSEIADPQMRAFARIESEQCLLQTWSALPVKFVPAPLAVIRAGQHKLLQLERAGSLGFEIPPTLVTTDPTELLAFYREHGGRVITKLLSSTSIGESGLGRDYLRFTERLSLRELARGMSAARLCPVYAQAYVPKDRELRITVVGDTVFAAEIESQRGAHGRVDWRKAGPVAVPYHPHSLDRAVAARCIALIRSLGLNYGAIDMVIRPDGAHVFLEVNPAGEYHWIEMRTGMPITAAICELLLGTTTLAKSA